MQNLNLGNVEQVKTMLSVQKQAYLKSNDLHQVQKIKQTENKINKIQKQVNGSGFFPSIFGSIATGLGLQSFSNVVGKYNSVTQQQYLKHQKEIHQIYQSLIVLLTPPQVQQLIKKDLKSASAIQNTQTMMMLKTGKIKNWQSYINAFTQQKATQNSTNAAVKSLFLRVIGMINAQFQTRIAYEAIFPLMANLYIQYPRYTSYQIYKLANAVYKNRQQYASAMIYNSIKLGSDKLQFKQLSIKPRHQYVYTWGNVFVFNTASQSPAQVWMKFEIQQGKNVDFLMTYDFDIQSRTITNGKISMGQQTVSYYINQTDTLWILCEKLFKMKLQYQQKTIQ